MKVKKEMNEVRNPTVVLTKHKSFTYEHRNVTIWVKYFCTNLGRITELEVKFIIFAPDS